MKDRGKMIVVSAQAIVVIGSLFLFAARSSFAKEREDRRQVVSTIIDVDVALQKINPPNLVVMATGEVPAAGYKDAKLSFKKPEKPPADGILDCELTAVPPVDGAAQVISKVTASETIENYEEGFLWLRGVRIHGKGSGVQVKMLDGGKALARAVGRQAADTGDLSIAAKAINALGIDLLKQPDLAKGDVLLSPYSIQCALAMTYAGADGETKAEMTKVLHYPSDEAQVHESFAGLQRSLEEVARATRVQAEMAKRKGEGRDPVIVTVANRLFGERSYEFQKPFLRQLSEWYGAPLEPMDFRGAPETAREAINLWVADQTQKRIPDLIPQNGIDKLSRLVLVNAIYLKAPWAAPFFPEATKLAPFYVKPGTSKEVPMMVKQHDFGYEQRDGYAVITVPYIGGDLHLLILLPDPSSRIQALQERLTPELLASCAKAGPREILLFLPKLDMQPQLMKLAEPFNALGMEEAFSPGSANFSRMALAQGGGGLFISEVFHKTFLKLDEKGTEAAAATAVVMSEKMARESRSTPIEIHVDRPFLFAIQHNASGACLFLGRVTDSQPGAKP